MAIWAFLKKWDVHRSNATVELVQQEEVFSLTVVLTLLLTHGQYHEKESEQTWKRIAFRCRQPKRRMVPMGFCPLLLTYLLSLVFLFWPKGGLR